jgi:hypothetical protein
MRRHARRFSLTIRRGCISFDAMGIADTNKSLATNRMVFELRRDAAALERFRVDFEGTMTAYGLSDPEKAAWRERDIGALGKLGVHPYFLPQIARLFRGGAYNHNRSAAARLYAATVLEPKG